MNSWKWIVRHFEELAERYAGRYIAVVNENVVGAGVSEADVEQEAAVKYPGEMPSIIYIPGNDDIGKDYGNKHEVDMSPEELIRELVKKLNYNSDFEESDMFKVEVSGIEEFVFERLKEF